ncbi:MAG: restriction endonuclease subunit S [Rubrivivax sp.]|nr:restriction endonuclease subunit S [Rubrivivax sp.]
MALYRQSLLKSAVEGTLTAEWRGNESTSAWSSATIGDLAEVGTGVTPLRSNSRYFGGGTIPWVTSGALNAALVTAGSEFVTEAAVAECRLKLYPPGTLLVAMYGEGKTRGKCSELAVAATINQAIAAIVLKPAFEKCRAFLKAFLWHSYESMRQQASGGVQPNLNLQIVKSISVPLPPLDEQQEIVRRLDTLLDAATVQEEALDRALAMVAAQRQNILRAAFSGQLVPQDPNDEPASVLLERIRAQRNAAADKPAARRPRKAKIAA